MKMNVVSEHQLEVPSEMLESAPVIKVKKAADRKRTWIEISIEILELCKGGAIKTRIVFRANLNFNIVKWYENLLSERGFLTKVGDVYFTTPKGEDWLSIAVPTVKGIKE